MSRAWNESAVSLINAVFLGLVTNLMLLISSAPVVLLLVTTDPAGSWPLIALLAPLLAPAVVGACTAFTAHRQGDGRVVTAYWAGWRRRWLRNVGFGALAVAALVVLLVDLKAISGAGWAAVAAPLIAVTAVIVLATCAIGLVAFAEVPTARFGEVVKAVVVLGVRRPLTVLASLLVLATQAWIFTALPAIALGGTAAPALYVVWSNARYLLLPVLPAQPDARDALPDRRDADPRRLAAAR